MRGVPSDAVRIFPGTVNVQAARPSVTAAHTQPNSLFVSTAEQLAGVSAVHTCQPSCASRGNDGGRHEVLHAGTDGVFEGWGRGGVICPSVGAVSWGASNTAEASGEAKCVQRLTNTEQ
jgi:hypothetical protein